MHPMKTLITIPASTPTGGVDGVDDGVDPSAICGSFSDGVGGDEGWGLGSTSDAMYEVGGAGGDDVWLSPIVGNDGGVLGLLEGNSERITTTGTDDDIIGGSDDILGNTEVDC